MHKTSAFLELVSHAVANNCDSIILMVEFLHSTFYILHLLGEEVATCPAKPEVAAKVSSD